MQASSLSNSPALKQSTNGRPAPAIDPNRPWIGPGYAQARIFVLGESYTGAYTDDLEYDDSYLTALLAGKPVLGSDLFFKMAEKLEMSLTELWQQVIFTNMALGSIGGTNATKVTPAQLRAGRPRLESLLLKHSPRGVLILGAKTGTAAEPICRKLGIASQTVYHPSGINNANPKTACTPTMLRAAWSTLYAPESQREVAANSRSARTLGPTPCEPFPNESPIKKTALRLHTSTGTVFNLIAYQFPESREKFNVFVNGSPTQAARTQAKGRKGDIRHYTYLRLGGKSMYVKAWLDANERVFVS